MLRTFTALIVMAVGGITVQRGFDIVRFLRATGQAQAAAVAPWIGRPGVSTLALGDLLATGAPDSDAGAAERRQAMLTQLLAVRPLGSLEWLSLAGMRLAATRPDAAVLAALTMSSITGPDLGGVMWQRGVLGLLEWGQLSEAARDRAVRDLAGPLVAGAVDSGAFLSVSSILGGETPEVRTRLAAGLTAEGVPAAMRARLGL